MKRESNLRILTRLALAAPVYKVAAKEAKIVFKLLGIRRSLGVRILEISIGLAVANFTDTHFGAVVATAIDGTRRILKEKDSADSEDSVVFLDDGDDQEKATEDAGKRLKKMMGLEEE